MPTSIGLRIRSVATRSEGAPGNPYRDSTLGWYALRFEITTPTWALLRDDTGLERAAADLYRRDRLGEPLGGIETPH